MKFRFQLWREAHFTAEELLIDSISGPCADPDNDCHCNLVEYALGLSPLEPSFEEFPVLSVSGSFCVLTYTRPADRDDITYLVEASSAPYGWSFLSVAHEQVASGDPERWQGSYYVGGRTCFMRLKVFLNSP